MEAIEVADLVVHTGTVSHPLLGRAHVIETRGIPVTAMSEIDWDAPREIPTIAEPGKLPAGSGTLLLNDIAIRARSAGITALRYAGPYPTHALFQSLLRSFRTTATVEAFTANVLERAVSLARDPVPVDFTPAPFTRTATSYGYCDVRDGVIERARIGDVVYDRIPQASSLAELVDDIAQVSVGVPIARVAKLAADGSIVDGPHPLPAWDTAANNTEFPQALRDELAEAAAGFVAPPLAMDVAQRIRTARIIWDNCGTRAGGAAPFGFRMHVGFLALAGHDMAMFAERLSYHLAMLAQASVLDDLLAARRQSSSVHPLP